MTVAVSVVVATYNTGEALDTMLDSVRRQSLGTDQLELVLVDDGSTDGTGERVEARAREHDWVVAHRIPNSGWPSRPRNVGFDMARGEYLMVMDHDDALFPEALERMVAAGRRAGADLVIGKEVRSKGRTPALDTFRRNVDRADIVQDEVLELLTPHRMWRRGFVREHGVRFSETLRRLEDHQIIAETLVHDPVVTILSDYPCYHWLIHGDNNSLRLPDPVAYYDALREVLDAVDRWPHSEEVKDSARRMWLRTTVLDRFGPSGLRSWPQEYQGPFFEQARGITLERLPEALDAGLPASHRVRAALLRSGDLEALLAYGAGDRHVTTRPQLVRASAGPDELRIEVTATLEAERGAVRFRRAADGRTMQEPTGPLDASVAERTLDVTQDLDTVQVDLVATHRGTNAEWLQPTTASVRLKERDDGSSELTVVAQGVLVPSTAQLGSPLAAGIWDLRLRTNALGFDSRAGVRIEPALLPGPVSFGQWVAEPYVTQGGRLALRVTDRTAPVRRSSAPRGRRWTAGRQGARRLLRRLRRRLGSAGD